jgi:biopolymer transport protein ExbD|nr:MAG: biopolymer transporter ExbD [Bacteroidota bacterium]
MATFKRKTQLKQSIPTASLPDIVFLLLIFFMVSTKLREVNLLVTLVMPQAEEIEKIEQKRLISYIWIGKDKGTGQYRVQIDDALVEIPEIRHIMYKKLLEEPRLIVSLRVDRDAPMGLVTDVQQELREAGTLRINYSTKRQAAT